LQTRKWQDQNGQDRYSTEVVLQGFNCQLVMLDGRGEGGGGGGGGGSREWGATGGGDDDFGGGSSFGGGSGGGSRGGSAPRGNDPFGVDLDDDVPF